MPASMAVGRRGTGELADRYGVGRPHVTVIIGGKARAVVTPARVA